MKNKTARRMSAGISIAILAFLFSMGLKTSSKYSTVKDWHYTAAMIGVVLMGCLILLCIAGFVLSFRSDKRHFVQ